MKLKCWLIPAIGALALGSVTVPAQAASGVTASLAIGADQSAGAEQVHYRYRYHRRHHYPRYYRYYRYPGFYFHFGHRRHHRHHRRYWRW